MQEIDFENQDFVTFDNQSLNRFQKLAKMLVAVFISMQRSN